MNSTSKTTTEVERNKEIKTKKKLILPANVRCDKFKIKNIFE